MSNRTIDMLVGDIYGGMDYSKIGLSASTIASSFGKAISENKDLQDYRPEDISLSLLQMISYKLDRSKGNEQAMFFRHEGFLGALAGRKVPNGCTINWRKDSWSSTRGFERKGKFELGVELGGLISWMEKFVQKGTEITAPVPMAPPGTTGLGGFEVPSSRGNTLRSDASNLNVGFRHLVPTLEVFPLLADPKTYEPNTIDLSDHSELDCLDTVAIIDTASISLLLLDVFRCRYWFTVLSEHLPDLVDKAVASEGGTDNAKRRGDAFARAFSAHLARLMEEPAAYGKLGLANLLGLRQECLREFYFVDAYRSIKQRENEASLAVLPDLLMEIDSMNEETRLLTLIEGVLAANIFDWDPVPVDDFDLFKERMSGSGDKKPPPHKRALLFVDNSGADVILGMLPLARELLRRGTEVVLVANSLPALNDVTAMELPDIVAEAAKHCDIIRRAAEAGGLLVDAMINIQDSSKENSVSAVP
ncbi:hypothetical protein ACSBR1_001625 [Camellia fascicularis]